MVVKDLIDNLPNEKLTYLSAKPMHVRFRRHVCYVKFLRLYRNEALCTYDFIAKCWYDLGPSPNPQKVQARVEAEKARRNKAVDEYLVQRQQREVLGK